MKFFINKLQLSISTNDIYPDGTKYCSFGDDFFKFIIEQKPVIRTLAFNLSFCKDSSSSEELYRLSLPYSVFIFNFSVDNCKICVGFSNTPIESLEQEIYYCCLPNVDFYRVCLGEYIHNSKTVREYINNAIDRFWNSQFSNDYYWCFYNKIPVSINKWHEETKINPFYGLQIPWKNNKGTPLNNF